MPPPVSESGMQARTTMVFAAMPVLFAQATESPVAARWT